MKYIIEDEFHCEYIWEFDILEDAISELKKLSVTKWMEWRNRPPCTSWKTCVRDYLLMEFSDTTKSPWKQERRENIFSINENGIKWSENSFLNPNS